MHHVDRGYPHPASTKEYLGGDLANLVYSPHITPGASWEEIWQGYEQLITAGKVLYAGSSNSAAWNIVQANERAAARHMLGLVSEQSKYSLMTREVELEVVTAPIIGPRTVAQLESAARAVDLALSDRTMAHLAEIFPGPANQAPEAYAW